MGRVTMGTGGGWCSRPGRVYDLQTAVVSSPMGHNQIQPADPALPGFQLATTPTSLQRQAFELLGVSHRLGVA